MRKKLRMTIMVGIAVLVSLLISACGSTSTGGSTPTPTTASGTTPTPTLNCVSGSITVSGSTALQPLTTAVAMKYQAQCSGATITVQGGGSKTGLSQAESGAVQVGDSDVFAAATQSDLVDHQVAVVVFVLATNPDVTGVTSLTSAQILSIYTGKTTNWNQVGGPNLPIIVVSRPVTSGTRATFKTYVLKGTAESPNQAKNLTADSTQLVTQTVEQTNGAIGYITLGAAMQEGSKLNVLSIDGNAPTPTNVESNSYIFWNIEHMYTKGAATGLAQAFINYMSTADAQTAAAQLQFLLIASMSPSAIAAHQPK
jgi:phosphate transport system substrate-binding protein